MVRTDGTMHTHDPLHQLEHRSGTTPAGGAPAGYRPGIDGLRAIAVAAVVAFHLWPATVPGGFLGVSLFFTLSGYLITSLLTAEHRRSGRIDLVRFLSRRFRRLAPLSLAVIAVVALWALLTRAPSSTAGEVLSSLFYVNNWWAILAGEGYGQLFVDPSPLEHFWSLAIEEQFYLVFPLIALVALRRSVSTLRTAVAVLFASSFLLAASGVLPHETAYLSTFTRASEILAGSLLAILWRPRRAGRGGTRTLPALPWLGAAALGVLVLGSFTIHFQDAFISRGGLSLLAVVWCVAVMWAATVGPSNVLCSTVAVWVGRRSYAIYLIHWPVIVWWHAPAVAQLALILALSALAHHVVEEPIRTRKALRGALGVAVGAVAMALLAIAGVTIGLRPPPPVETVAERVETIAPSSSTVPRAEAPVDAPDDGQDPTEAPEATPSAPAEPVIWWVGDSQADGVLDYLLGRRDPEADPDAPRDTEPTASRIEFLSSSYVVVDLAIPGCDGAFGLDGFAESPTDPDKTECTDWAGRWQSALDAFGPPDTVIWMTGATTFVQPWVMEDGISYYPTDSAWMQQWRPSVEQRLDWIEDNLPDARVLWTEPMRPVRDLLARLTAPSDAEWARTVLSAEAVAETQRSVAAERSGVTVRSFSAAPEDGGAGLDLATGTYDGIHLDRATAATVVLPWLFAQVDALTAAVDDSAQ